MLILALSLMFQPKRFYSIDLFALLSWKEVQATSVDGNHIEAQGQSLCLKLNSLHPMNYAKVYQEHQSYS